MNTLKTTFTLNNVLVHSVQDTSNSYVINIYVDSLDEEERNFLKKYPRQGFFSKDYREVIAFSTQHPIVIPEHVDHPIERDSIVSIVFELRKAKYGYSFMEGIKYILESSFDDLLKCPKHADRCMQLERIYKSQLNK